MKSWLVKQKIAIDYLDRKTDTTEEWVSQRHNFLGNQQIEVMLNLKYNTTSRTLSDIALLLYVWKGQHVGAKCSTLSLVVIPETTKEENNTQRKNRRDFLEQKSPVGALCIRECTG